MERTPMVLRIILFVNSSRYMCLVVMYRKKVAKSIGLLQMFTLSVDETHTKTKPDQSCFGMETGAIGIQHFECNLDNYCNLTKQPSLSTVQRHIAVLKCVYICDVLEYIVVTFSFLL